MIIGIFAIIIGIVFLLKNLGLVQLPASFWSILWPAFLIILGIYMVIGARKGRYYRNWFMRRGWRKPEDDDRTM